MSTFASITRSQNVAIYAGVSSEFSSQATVNGPRAKITHFGNAECDNPFGIRSRE